MRRSDPVIAIVLGAILLAAIHYYVSITLDVTEPEDLIQYEETVPGIIDQVTLNQYGIPEDAYHIIEGRVRRNQNLSQILSGYNINPLIIHQIASYSPDMFNVRRIRPGDRYRIFVTNDSLNLPGYLIYDLNPFEYVRVKLYDTVHLERSLREVHQILKNVAGSISSSLWNAVVEDDGPPLIAIELSEIYAWNIDFFNLRRGDSFKAFYYENYVDSVPAGIERIEAAYFRHMERDFYAIPFEQDSVISFFDQDGNSLRRTFLKAPLRYSRISSGFSHSRMHPILRIRRPHYGVDYAAPVGTPVYAIGDGMVTETSYSAGAGRLVRIRHNSVYTSAYLHLRNFEPGIKPNVWVKQGDVIGFVGSSGMSTGPHLDFRVWRNGHPVDPLSIESPPVEPVREENMEEFKQIRAHWTERLDNL